VHPRLKAAPATRPPERANRAWSGFGGAAPASAPGEVTARKCSRGCRHTGRNPCETGVSAP